MKQINQINKTGVWIDYDKAYVIRLSKGKEQLKRIDSNIEHFNLKGGSRSKVSYGPQDNVSESKLLARKKQQQSSFFTKIIEVLNPQDQIIVFGPATAKIGLKKVLEQHPLFRQNDISIESSDSMTENQMKAWIRNYEA